MRDFDRLPIPFRAVSTDMVTGTPYVFEQGPLYEAMRASMSIPGVFSPAEFAAACWATAASSTTCRSTSCARWAPKS